MGLCGSKSDQSTGSIPASRPATTRTAKSLQEQPKKKKQLKKSSKPLRTGETAIQKKAGDRINEAGDDTKEKLTAQEAARLAAEKRLQEANEKSTRGALGKKLAEERSKSHKTHMMQEVEKRDLKKANENLVYD